MKNSLNKNAFFFQGDSLILPQDVAYSEIEQGIPLEFADTFENKEIFEIPELKNPYVIGADSQNSDSTNTNLHENVIRGVSVATEPPLPPGWKSITVREVLFMINTGVEWADSLVRILRAFHIAQWRDNSRYCGKCGTKNDDASNELARECPACGRLEFPRISPAIIAVIVNDNDEILLAHNKFFASKMYSHIAGFVDVGETLEETVKREIREEINIEVKDIQYLKSQPWPFPNSLMIGFYARYASGMIRPDGVEIEDAKWFSKDSLPELPQRGSLSRHFIDCWLKDELL
jgi:NAD+ diphosphatase